MTAIKPLTKKQIVSALAEKTNKTKKDINNYLSSLKTLVFYEIQKNGAFIIPGIVKIEKVYRKARSGRNPATGERIIISGKNVLKFKASGPFRETVTKNRGGLSFALMDLKDKVLFLKKRTETAGHPYLNTIVAVSEEYNIDSRLFSSVMWEENWFANSPVSNDFKIKEDIKKCLGYIRHEFVYYRKKGFEKRSSTICALVSYKQGDSVTRKQIREGMWDGKEIETIPFQETRDFLKRVFFRCKKKYQAFF